MPSVSLEELHAFHSIDRQIFTRLVINLMRDPSQSLLVMALWLWFEDARFAQITETMLTLSDATLNALANEAVACLRAIESSRKPPSVRDGGMTLTSSTMGKDITLQMVYEIRFTVISGVKSFLTKVCALALTDILVQVLERRPQETPGQILVVPGFPHPTFGRLTVIPLPLHYRFPLGGLWGWKLNVDAPVDDRTLFLTFSRGYPVSPAEVREIFEGSFGDCVERVEMEQSSYTSEQPLYAKMVVRHVTIIDRILKGGCIAKFRINGKHVWARKYERRDLSQRAN